MHTVKVELLAFRNGDIREVQTPDLSLDTIFHYGQNDFQPKPLPSVSVGDIIHLPSTKDSSKIEYHIVQDFGFQRLAESDYKQYKAFERRDRLFSKFVRTDMWNNEMP